MMGHADLVKIRKNQAEPKLDRIPGFLTGVEFHPQVSTGFFYLIQKRFCGHFGVSSVAEIGDKFFNIRWLAVLAAILDLGIWLTFQVSMMYSKRIKF